MPLVIEFLLHFIIAETVNDEIKFLIPTSYWKEGKYYKYKNLNISQILRIDSHSTTTVRLVCYFEVTFIARLNLIFNTIAF